MKYFYETRFVGSFVLLSEDCLIKNCFVGSHTCTNGCEYSKSYNDQEHWVDCKLKTRKLIKDKLNRLMK